MDLPESHKGGVDSLHSPPLPVKQQENDLHFLTKMDLKYNDNFKTCDICI